MESTRPIRALLRGLDALTVLNLRNGATVSEVAAEIRLPRTTTYRILETLCHAGYVFRGPADDRYRLTSTVRGLADGFDDEASLVQIACESLQQLAREIGAATALAILSGATMRVHEITARAGEHAFAQYCIGFRMPVLTTAHGRTYLAHCAESQRTSLLELLSRSRRDEDRLAHDRAGILQLVEEVRGRGYGTAVQARRVSDEITIAVPILAGERVLGSLAARFAGSPVPSEESAARFVPALQAAAGAIGARFLERVPVVGSVSTVVPLRRT